MTPPAKEEPLQSDAATDTDSVVKATFNIPARELDALRRLAARRRTNVTHALRQAIKTELYLQDAIDEGGTVLIEQGGKFRELVFRT